MGLRNFKTIETKEHGDHVIKVLEENLSDSYPAYSVEIYQPVNEEGVILDCSCKDNAYELFESLTKYVC